MVNILYQEEISVYSNMQTVYTQKSCIGYMPGYMSLVNCLTGQ